MSGLSKSAFKLGPIDSVGNGSPFSSTVACPRAALSGEKYVIAKSVSLLSVVSLKNAPTTQKRSSVASDVNLNS